MQHNPGILYGGDFLSLLSANKPTLEKPIVMTIFVIKSSLYKILKYNRD